VVNDEAQIDTTTPEPFWYLITYLDNFVRKWLMHKHPQKLSNPRPARSGRGLLVKSLGLRKKEGGHDQSVSIRF
jgi:hypothetical protein